LRRFQVCIRHELRRTRWHERHECIDLQQPNTEDAAFDRALTKVPSDRRLPRWKARGGSVRGVTICFPSSPHASAVRTRRRSPRSGRRDHATARSSTSPEPSPQQPDWCSPVRRRVRRRDVQPGRSHALCEHPGQPGHLVRDLGPVGAHRSVSTAGAAGLVLRRAR
jgi:hypothetical protein